MTDVHELVRFQGELKEEEQLIVAMLSKIEVQLHALQVERLQLLSAKNSANQESFMTQNSVNSNEPTPTDTDVKKELDLVVPHAWQESEDDEEEEEDSS